MQGSFILTEGASAAPLAALMEEKKTLRGKRTALSLYYCFKMYNPSVLVVSAQQEPGVQFPKASFLTTSGVVFRWISLGYQPTL